MPDSAMPGMEWQASPKVTEQRRGKLRYVCSVATGSIEDAGRWEGERVLQGCVMGRAWAAS